MKRLLYILCLLFISNSPLKAQLTISNGEHIAEFSTRLSTYYNQRFLKSGEEDAKKNRFKLRDAQFKVEGRIRTTWEYELQVDFADIAMGDIDAENPGIMDANVTYKGLSFVDIKLGYGKLPYSRSSLVPFPYAAYWQRAQIARGDLFSRRDVGLTLSKSLWKNRINSYAGVYTGLGELSLQGDNDASGSPEFVGRVDVSYPASSKYREIDYSHSPVPLISLGVNGRYADKTLPEGEEFPDDAAGEYGMKIIDGKKYTYGMDFTLLYRGWSAQFEIHQIKGEPRNDDDALLQGLDAVQTDGYFLAGGYLTQISYFLKNWNTILSARYEELDLTDLVAGNSKRAGAAINYHIDGFDASIRIQYFKILEEESIDPLKWHDQIRVGMVLNL